MGTPARIRSWTLGIRVNLERTATGNLLGLCGGCALAICDGKIHQSGGPRQKVTPPLFLCSFSGAYSTYTSSLALAPKPTMPPAPLLPGVAANRNSRKPVSRRGPLLKIIFEYASIWIHSNQLHPICVLRFFYGSNFVGGKRYSEFAHHCLLRWKVNDFD